jgi:Ca-activated chloride channel family protein
VVILLTDGRSNAGPISPQKTGEIGKSLGVKVYTIGAGTNGMAPVRVEDPFTGQSVLRATPVEIDEAMLQQIATATGGAYFRATNGQGLLDIYKQIDTLERTEFTENRFLRYEEHYRVMLAIGLALACAAWTLRGSLLRRQP